MTSSCLDDGVTAVPGDGPGDPFGAVDVDVGEDDGHAGLGEADRDRLAEAAAGTGDDGDATGQVEDVAGVAGRDRQIAVLVAHWCSFMASLATQAVIASVGRCSPCVGHALRAHLDHPQLAGEGGVGVSAIAPASVMNRRLPSNTQFVGIVPAAMCWS